MIKGIYLTENPNMDKVSNIDILSDLDFLFRESEPSVFNGDLFSMRKTTFNCNKFVINVYESSKGSSLDGMFIAYNIIQRANPSFVRVFKFGENRLISAYPNYFIGDDEDEEYNVIYSRMIEELLRISVFLLKNNSPEEASYLLRDYINLSISYPGNRK